MGHLSRLGHTRIAAGGLVVLLALLVSACLLAPGKFTSTMDVRADGTFSFRYTGDLVFLPLASPDARKKEKDAAFEQQPCFDDASGQERMCTDSEVAEQKRQAEQNAAASAKGEAEMAKAFLGGIDPKDPKTAEELAAKLRRQAGWRKVAYKGDGVYDVDFTVSGRLDHDFVFPVIEGLPVANAFVVASLRNDGTVRIDAPGYGPEPSGMPMGAMMQQAGKFGGKEGNAPDLPELDGTFTLRTDGTILANNTDEGPRQDTTGNVLSWKVDAGRKAAPMALIRLTP